MPALLSVDPQPSGYTRLVFDLAADKRLTLVVPMAVWASLSAGDLAKAIELLTAQQRPPLTVIPGGAP